MPCCVPCPSSPPPTVTLPSPEVCWEFCSNVTAGGRPASLHLGWKDHSCHSGGGGRTGKLTWFCRGGTGRGARPRQDWPRLFPVLGPVQKHLGEDRQGGWWFPWEVSLLLCFLPLCWPLTSPASELQLSPRDSQTIHGSPVPPTRPELSPVARFSGMGLRVCDQEPGLSS